MHHRRIKVITAGANIGQKRIIFKKISLAYNPFRVMHLTFGAVQVSYEKSGFVGAVELIDDSADHGAEKKKTE